jgi:hypothetical protein
MGSTNSRVRLARPPPISSVTSSSTGPAIVRGRIGTILSPLRVSQAPSSVSAETGLAPCAIGWMTIEDLLGRLIGADAPPVWQWLTRRPFGTAGPRGLFTHDLASDVPDAEFQRRASERYRTTRWTIYTHAVAGLRGGTDLDRPLHAQQLAYLLRISPVAHTIARLRAQGPATIVPARIGEHDQVCAATQRRPRRRRRHRFRLPPALRPVRAALRPGLQHHRVVDPPAGVVVPSLLSTASTWHRSSTTWRSPRWSRWSATRRLRHRLATLPGRCLVRPDARTWPLRSDRPPPAALLRPPALDRIRFAAAVKTALRLLPITVQSWCC